ncbi:MAG: DUF1385 domain-containing protein [Acidobacteria bacterium]|nr:DUF1385 domain-containing protein [Acidobacteriota bacterium]
MRASRAGQRLSSILLAQESVLLGGQAVLEGVMMRSPGAYAVAVRRPDGGIALLGEAAVAWTRRTRWLRLPVLRGAVTLVQSLAIGIRALNFSSEQAFPEQQQAGTGSAGPWRTALTLGLALLLAIGLFFLLPLGITEVLRRVFPGLGTGVAYNLVEGLIRVAIFIGYILAITAIPDVRRLFRYHGAEHKVVHAYEAGRGLDVATVQQFSTLHPRCGTSFLLFVVVLAVLLFSLVPADWGIAGRAVSRVVLIPLVAGLAYEAIRLSARFRSRLWARAVMAPGLLLQRLTTAPPDDRMIEVALAALRHASELEGGERALVL